MNKIYNFNVSGGFDISDKFEEVLSCTGEVYAFKLPDGRSVKLSVALEVESKNGRSFKYIISEAEMSKLGFECLDYTDSSFEEVILC